MLELAHAIEHAADMREGSWDGKEYTMSIDHAAHNIGKSADMMQLVSILLTACWNDALAWAEGVIDK